MAMTLDSYDLGHGTLQVGKAQPRRYPTWHAALPAARPPERDRRQSAHGIVEARLSEVSFFDVDASFFDVIETAYDTVYAPLMELKKGINESVELSTVGLRV